jgi:hypothetical protein
MDGGPRLGRRAAIGGGAAAAAALLWPRAAAAGEDALDEALELFAGTGPEYGGGLANHGPMAVEALITLGRPRAALAWAAGYRRRLDDPPSERDLIRRDTFEAALGDQNRLADFIAFFRRELAEASWRASLSRWLPVLLPGLSAAGLHGLIRTAHAVRALGRRETEPRRRELCEGLGYWAARFQRLPAGPERPGKLHATSALARVPRLRPGQRRRGGIPEALRSLPLAPAFADSINLLDPSGGPQALGEVTEAFAGVYLASVDTAGNAISFVHAITGPSALRLLLPCVPAASAQGAVRFAWQAAAGIYAAYGAQLPASAQTAAPLATEALIDRAIASGDEHAIKLTEACLREHALRPSAAYLLAAADASARFGG